MATKVELEEQLKELEKVNEELKTIVTDNKIELKKYQENGIKLLSTIESLKEDIKEKDIEISNTKNDLLIKVNELNNKKVSLEKEIADLKQDNIYLNKNNVDLLNKLNKTNKEPNRQPAIATELNLNSGHYKYNLEQFVCYPNAYSNMPFKVLEHQGHGTEGPLYRIHNFENDIMLYNVSEKNLDKLATL